MKLKIVLSLLLFCQISFGQWISLGVQGDFLFMTSDDFGYKAKGNYNSPSSGTDWSFSLTENNWINQKGAGGFSGGFGCCSFSRFVFINDSTGIVEGQNIRNYLKTSDFGNSWSLFGNDAKLGKSELTMVNDSVAYALGAISWSNNSQTRFYKMTDSKSFLRFTIDSVQFGACNVEFTDQYTGFIAMNDDHGSSFLFKTYDEGISWNKVFRSANEITHISFPRSIIGYLSTVNGEVYKTQDSGMTWVNIIQIPSVKINALEFINDTIGYAVCDTGKIFKTSDGGSSWTQENSGTTSNIVQVQITSINRAYCYTDDNLLLLKNDGSLPSRDPSSIRVYPNPATSSISFTLPPDYQSSAVRDISIYDVSGHLSLSSSDTPVDISHFAPGLYLIVVDLGDQLLDAKFIKM